MHGTTTFRHRLRCRIVGVTAFSAVFVFLLCGCADDGRQGVEGTVSINGKPLSEGYVRIAGDVGPSAGAPVEDGRFRIARPGGVLEGSFRVEITSLQPTGRKVLDPESNKEVDEYLQFLPPRYNSATELTIEVTQHGSNRFDFDLKVP